MRKLLWLALLCLGLPVYTLAQDSLLFVLRVDDIISRNTTMLPRTISHFQEMAESKGAVVSWGVMPHRLIEPNVNNGELGRDLRQTVLNGHEISLHGYLHICQRCNQSSHEMYCTTHNHAFTYAQQEKLITDGLKLLADSVGIRPVSFIPPGHVVDATTFQVLRDQGFHTITVPGEADFVTPGLYNIGTSDDFGWQVTSSNYVTRRTQALRDIRQQASNTGLYTLLLHDPFTRMGYNNGILINWTAEVLDSVKAEYGDKLRFVTISQASEAMLNRLVSIDQPTDEIPISTELHQNYPNPFNPSTVVSFYLPEAGLVRLTVHDLLGRQVGLLREGFVEAGSHSAGFNADWLPSGVYVYRLETPEATLSRKMILVK